MKTDALITPEFRVSFPFVFIPQKAMEAGKKDKYSVVMLFPKGADLTKLRQAAEKAAFDKWGANPPKPLHSPFRDQGEKDMDGYEAGATFVTATSVTQPGLVDANVQTIMDQSQFYSGCYAKAEIAAFAFEVRGPDGRTVVKRGVSFGLRNLQKTRDGESLTGRLKPEDVFVPVDSGKTGAAPADAADSVFG